MMASTVIDELEIHYLHRPGVGANLSENLVTSFAEAIDARVWVGTYGGGLNRLEPATSRFDHYRHDPDDDHQCQSPACSQQGKGPEQGGA